VAKILVVEDDVEYSEVLRSCLQTQNYQVEQAFDGLEALDFLKGYQYDLIVLDWNLPGRTGVEILQEFRSAGGKTAILMLTAQDQIHNKEEGLNSGADDYLTKPAHPAEFIARVKALLRRPTILIAHELSVRHVKIDPQTHVVTCNGSVVQMLPREFALLEFLMRHPGRVFSSDDLISRVWPSDASISSEVVRTTVNRIRSKIDLPDTKSIIRTIYSVGYCVEP
jgi:DNA-binding response OmpR family regulator